MLSSGCVLLMPHRVLKYVDRDWRHTKIIVENKYVISSQIYGGSFLLLVDEEYFEKYNGCDPWDEESCPIMPYWTINLVGGGEQFICGAKPEDFKILHCGERGQDYLEPTGNTFTFNRNTFLFQRISFGGLLVGFTDFTPVAEIGKCSSF